MKKNLGQVDKIARIVVGLLLIALTLLGTIGVWGWIGVVPLVTGVMGTCPAYSLFGVSTCSLERKPQP
jgi:fatty acid desaturase